MTIIRKIVITATVSLLFSLSCYAQNALELKDTGNDIVLINLEKLLQMCNGIKSCLLLKPWIPNCPTAERQFKEYMEFTQKTDMTIIFLGITNSPEKIKKIAAKNKFNGTLYMLDTAIAKDIYERFDLFKKQKEAFFNIHIGATPEDLIIDKNKKVIYNKTTIGFEDTLLTICK